MPRFTPRLAGMAALACLLVASPAFTAQAVPIHESLTVATAPTGTVSSNPLVLTVMGQNVLPIAGTPAFTQAVLDFDIAPLTPGSPFLGTIVFTAANGGTLNGFFFGEYVDSTDFVGTVIFTGGTGQFARARGTASLAGMDLGSPFFFQATIDGSIHN